MSKKKVSKKANDGKSKAKTVEGGNAEAATSFTTEVLIQRIETLEKLVVGKNALLKRIGTLELQVDAAKANVDRINKRVVIISDGLKFIADNVRNVYGLSGLGIIIDAVTAKFK